MRHFTPYEQTQLARYGQPGLILPDDDQTPVEYLTGKVEFDGMVFLTKPGVLIPRPETEELVALAWQDLQRIATSYRSSFDQAHEPLRLIDVGTGSGVIGLSLAKRLATASVPFELYLTDINPVALELARQNALKIKSHLSPITKVAFQLSSLLENTAPPPKFDFIISNPPYVPTNRLAHLPKAVTAFESLQALDGGTAGSDLINQLLTTAQKRLNAKAVLWLEIDESHSLPTFATAITYYDLSLHQDQYGKTRFLRARLKT